MALTDGKRLYTNLDDYLFWPNMKGFIDLCAVESVQYVTGNTIKLLMRNGLSTELHTTNDSDMDAEQWAKRLQGLIEYWTKRKKADLDLYRAIREQTLEELGIGEQTEDILGLYAQKWEQVSKYYMLPALDGRTSDISMSGPLFRKKRKYTTFEKCHAILMHDGHLHIYQDTLRKGTGKRLPQIHHKRLGMIDLKACTLESGPSVEKYLLYQNQTFDSIGHHALPKIYLDSNLTSCDDDISTTFVIKGKRGGIFMARSRAEKDHWVQAIQEELSKVSQT